MRPILCGIETEYGFTVEGRGPENQIDDSQAIVRLARAVAFSGWNYQYEAPRADLRGFTESKLSVDPVDAQFDRGRSFSSNHEERADQILLSGARLYNDHGHPEYATPECWGLEELVLHDLAGEQVVAEACRAFAAKARRETRLYKNNTDYHGASYGTHESYSLPRAGSVESLMNAVVPMLVARTMLCGAGKVGSEVDPSVSYQASQRADYFSVVASVDTLYRRPIFNTRDEPHADGSNWRRLHVISGDANRMPSCTRRKVGLVKLALHLWEADAVPAFNLQNPVFAFRQVSHGLHRETRLDLAGGSWTSAEAILRSYLEAAERLFESDPVDGDGAWTNELLDLVTECDALLTDLRREPRRAADRIDWAAKLELLEQFRESQGLDWSDESLPSIELAYHLVDPEESLYDALCAQDLVHEGQRASEEIDRRRSEVGERSRAWVRSLILRRFASAIESLTWGKVGLSLRAGSVALDLKPDVTYPAELESIDDLETFVKVVEQVHDHSR